MQAGFVQFAPELCNLSATLEKLEAVLNSCPDADLLVLPELANSGYNFSSPSEAYSAAEKVDDSVFLSRLQQYCRRKNCFISTGFCEKDGGKLYNSAVLVGPSSILGRYRKIHLFNTEKNFFEAGNVGLPVCDTPVGKLAMLICFDWMFPEVWRILALKGAEVICHSCALVMPGLAQRATPIRALTNRFYVITANRIGVENGLAFTGRSIAADPLGNVLYTAQERAEECKAFEFDLKLARNKMISPQNDIMRDRRPDLYREILNHHNEVKK